MHTDLAIAHKAGSSLGIITLAELEAIGRTRSAVAKRVRRGLLRRIHPGVFAVGTGEVSMEARCLAAARATGGCVTGLVAASLYRASRFPFHCIDVVGPGQHRGEGLRHRRSSTMVARDVRVVRGVPCASPSRMLLDVAGELTALQVASIVHELAFKRLFNLREASRIAAVNARVRGAGTMRDALVLRAMGCPGTRSMVEDVFLAGLAARGHPTPEVNMRRSFGADSFELDCFWPRWRLNIELDGPGHERPANRAHDAARDAALAAHGVRVVRVPAWDLELGFEAVAMCAREQSVLSGHMIHSVPCTLPSML